MFTTDESQIRDALTVIYGASRELGRLKSKMRDQAPLFAAARADATGPELILRLLTIPAHGPRVQELRRARSAARSILGERLARV